MSLIDFLGLGLAGYGVYGVLSGQVYAKDKWSGRYVFRREQPGYFYLVCACYVVVGVGIFFV